MFLLKSLYGVHLQPLLKNIFKLSCLAGAKLPCWRKAGSKRSSMTHFVDLLRRVDVDAVEDVGDDDDGHDDTDGGLRDRTYRQAGLSQ